MHVSDFIISLTKGDNLPRVVLVDLYISGSGDFAMVAKIWKRMFGPFLGHLELKGLQHDPSALWGVRRRKLQIVVYKTFCILKSIGKNNSVCENLWFLWTIFFWLYAS